MPRGIYNRKKINGWSKKFNKCQGCGTTDRPYFAKGLCKKCYSQLPEKKEYHKAYLKVYRQTPKARKYKKEYQKKYNQSLKGKEVDKKYFQSSRGRETYRKHHRKQRAIKKSFNFWEDWMDDVWKQKLIETKGYCPKCNKYIGIDKLTMDHIMPLTKGGVHRIDNVQPLCFSCNSSKSTKF